MELKEIKAIIDLMTKNGLSEFELERQEFKIRVKRGQGGEFIPVIQSPTPIPAAALPVSSPAPLPASTATATAADNLPTINSPMVGTFYSSPSPDAPTYVAAGKEVTPDTVVCIIEAMKIMNEIKAEMKGVITEILVENNKPVEFGTPLFRIKPL